MSTVADVAQTTVEDQMGRRGPLAAARRTVK